MRVTITINTESAAFKRLDTTPGPEVHRAGELLRVAEQAASLVLQATGRLAHLPHTEIRPLFDSDGVKCGSVRVEE